MTVRLFYNAGIGLFRGNQYKLSNHVYY